MAAFGIGAAAGLIELYLLSRLVLAVHAGQSGRVAMLAFAKFLVLACAFVPVIMYFRGDLLYCAIGVTVTLIVGAFARNIYANAKNKKGN